MCASTSAVESMSAWDLVGEAYFLTIQIQGVNTCVKLSHLIWLCSMVSVGMNCQITSGGRKMLMTDNIFIY